VKPANPTEQIQAIHKSLRLAVGPAYLSIILLITSAKIGVFLAVTGLMHLAASGRL